MSIQTINEYKDELRIRPKRPHLSISLLKKYISPSNHKRNNNFKSNIGLLQKFNKESFKLHSLKNNSGKVSPDKLNKDSSLIFDAGSLEYRNDLCISKHRYLPSNNYVKKIINKQKLIPKLNKTTNLNYVKHKLIHRKIEGKEPYFIDVTELTLPRLKNNFYNSIFIENVDSRNEGVLQSAIFLTGSEMKKKNELSDSLKKFIKFSRILQHKITNYKPFDIYQDNEIKSTSIFNNTKLCLHTKLTDVILTNNFKKTRSKLVYNKVKKEQVLSEVPKMANFSSWTKSGFQVYIKQKEVN